MVSGINIALIAGLSVNLWSCVANAPTGGACERKCGARPVGGGNITAMPLTSDISLKAAGCTGKPFAGPFDIHFLVYEDLSPAAGGSDSGDSSSGGSTTEKSVQAATPKRIPKAGIAFFPNVNGYSASAENSTDTPSSEWCTDSCGVATVRVSPTCIEQTMVVGIVVPGISGESTSATERPVKSVNVGLTQ